METKTIPSTFNLGDQVSYLLDSLHLLTQVLSLQEVTQMGISFALTYFVKVKKTLINLINKDS